MRHPEEGGRALSLEIFSSERRSFKAEVLQIRLLVMVIAVVVPQDFWILSLYSNHTSDATGCRFGRPVVHHDPNPNYVPLSMAMTSPPIVQQAASTATPTRATDAMAPESNHGSKAAADAPPPLPTTQLCIWPDGSTGFFTNTNACTQKMTNVIKLMYDQPWPSYTKILAETSCTSFRMLSMTWPSEKYSTIGLVGGSSRCWIMFVMGKTSRRTSLLVHWETDAEFRHQRLTNQANRASIRSSEYTNGSTTFMKTNARLLKSLERKATLAETFKYTHTLKENKARFVYQRSQDHYESYTLRLEAATQQSQ
ncbi:hypothetical protein Ahy_B05g075714 [Arachis hypogaea]|uniref:Uncharacterized protein n=1 Tax=Arachis hypogaea TaxID=3818 RepID=A0A444Z1W3_ARAHY|nr:hypothetical protein Ahy_B05g075714 [Arachis hypogaea]